jgi:hypothetical protein
MPLSNPPGIPGQVPQKGGLKERRASTMIKKYPRMNNQYPISKAFAIAAAFITPPPEGQGGGHYV